nr:unnamed protein product [Digitaria exilis]
MLWVDKYRPKTLDKVTVHDQVAQNLRKLVSEQDCPHLLFYGPSGSGKKTLILALIKQMFGAGAEKVRMENKTWKIDTGTRTLEIELAMLSSAHHVEMNPSDAGFQDRYPFTSNQVAPPLDWEQYVSEIATDILTEQSPKRLYAVRQKLYELLVNCIPPESILKKLLTELLRKLDADLKHEICHWAAHYEHKMRLGSKAIFHLEAFVAKFMSIYKEFLVASFG